jgi:small conductance mechanosensitive channel
MEQYLDKIMEMASLYGVKVITALVVFIVGRWVAKGVRALVTRVMSKANVDPILVGFTSNIAYIALLVFVVVAALGQLGIQTTSFIAILGAAGLAIGLALQGSLSNFAAGFLMVIFRPFNVGDYIQGAVRKAR